MDELADRSRWIERGGRLKPPHAQKVRNRHREISGILSDRDNPLYPDDRMAPERVQPDLHEARDIIDQAAGKWR